MLRATQRLLFTVFGTAGLAATAAGAYAAPNAAPALAPAATPTPSEPTITTPGANGDYIRAVHGRLHGRWTEDFVKVVAATRPADHALNNTSRKVVLTLSIRWDGTVAELAVKKTSGSPEFDRAALDVTRKAAPFPLPSQEVLSDDSYAHLEWTFARDHRACAADARLWRVDDPLDISLPRLLMANKVAEALRRVSESSKDTGDVGLDRFARLYLGRTAPDPVLNVAASLALADAGDRSQTARLRAALGSQSTVEIATPGLVKLDVDVCEAVRGPMETGTAREREVAILAARAAAKAGANVAACGNSLTVLVSDSRQPTALRLSAFDAISTLAPSNVRAVVAVLQQDPDPAVRGVAVLASVKKGGGRPEMYRLSPMLRDKAVEIRGAAAAGMIRAGGDMALDQLYLLARETDPRPGQAVAAELAHSSSRASAEFLGRMVKKTNFPVQVAAARVLAGRKDAGARAELETVKVDARIPGDVRAIASGQTKAAPAAAASASTGTAAGSAADTAATAPVLQMLKARHNREAAEWIVAKLESLEPRQAIDVLGAWLRRGPSAAADNAAPAAKPQPETAAPAPSVPAAAPSAASALSM